MTDTIRVLIDRVLDYVERTPGARFEIGRYSNAVSSSVYHPYYFRFKVYTGLEFYFIERYGDLLWLSCADLTEDNLRYLLGRLEGEKR